MAGSSRLIKAGLLVFVIALVVSFPARVAYRWFAPPQFVASGISGSIWSGRAAEASAAGAYFRDLNWDIRLLDLLTAKLGYAIESKLSSGFVEGNIAVGFGGTLRATELRATLPLASMQSISGIAGIRGSATVNLSQLEISDGMPRSAQGIVEISGLTVPLVSSDPIGGFKAEFFSQDSGIAASLEDTNAVIDLAGSLQVTADGGYKLLAQLSATDQTPAAIRQQLEFLGPANDRGQHELRLEGKL